MQQINKLKRSFQKRVGGDLEEKASVKVCIRYAMKALSNVSVLKIFDREGLSFDCSSIYEVMRVIKAGISPERIELVSQEMTRAQLEMLKGVKGADKVLFVASSQ
jgi:diaminopimelate decarboxylase